MKASNAMSDEVVRANRRLDDVVVRWNSIQVSDLPCQGHSNIKYFCYGFIHNIFITFDRTIVQKSAFSLEYLQLSSFRLIPL